MSSIPLDQIEQVCAWCGNHLLAGEEVAVYNGPSALYPGWYCHLSCNEFFKRTLSSPAKNTRSKKSGASTKPK